jgi:AcrR family transcriptional regulator
MARRRDGLLRRDALLDAALACFSRANVLEVGIEQVRREAGASPSSVYNLFASMHEITLALLERTFQRLFAHLVAKTAEARGAKAVVTTLVAAHLEWVFAHRGEARFMYQATAIEQSPGTSDALARKKAEMLAPLSARVAPLIEAGALPPWSTLQFDVVVLGPSHEACRRFLAGAPLDSAWMKIELPLLAWRTVDAARRREKGSRA